MPHIVFLKDGRQSIRFPLKTAQVMIGRGGDCEVTLEGPQISRHHAAIVYQDGYYYLEDKSKNGTWINDRPARKERLQDKDKIRIGDWSLEFLDDLVPETQATVTVAATKAGKSSSDSVFAGMIGSSPKMKAIFKLIEKVAPSAATVLIFGETGTGKELVASALHQLSPRAVLPFVVINCAAISANLVESELFGHERGAFTGAIQTHRGAFEQAEGGTLLLDEIGDLSLDLQSKLLRTLEVQKIRRVGGDMELLVKCRVLAATHRDLTKEVKAGKFREDLYYRLFVMPMELPPLRQRREDIPLLARHFLQEMQAGGKMSLSREASRKLEGHLWPGNVRELKNVILRAALLADQEVIGSDQIVFLPNSVGEGVREPQTLAEMEREMILQKLNETRWNRAATARELGLSVSTIFKKIKEYGLKES